MALRVPKASAPQLFKEGYKYLQGVDEAVLRNIAACKDLTNITRTSFGPCGRNKLIVNHLEKLFLTSDAATIIRELEVVHPAAKLLVMASQQQDSEQGDGTNFVLVFAGELLSKAERLLTIGLHTSDIVQGYEVALNLALENLAQLQSDEIKDVHREEELQKAVKCAISAKSRGHEWWLSPLVVEAARLTMPSNQKSFNVDSVRVVKVMGGSMSDSKVVRGMVFGREPESTRRKQLNAKVAVFSCPIDIGQTETKGTVLLKSAQEMLDFSKGEENQMEKMIKEVADAGVKVIVTGGTIGELALHYINRFDLMAVKVLSKFDLRRLCKVIGATPLARFGAPTPEEMGFCSVAETVEIGSDRVTVFRQEDENSTKTATILLRGATQNVLDDLERAIEDGINVVKVVAKDGRLVAGGGAVELELARRLLSQAEKTSGLFQHAIKAFSEALESIPRALAENAGFDATETISTLYALHHQGRQTVGVKLDGEWEDDEKTGDMMELKVYDSVAVKENALRLATDAALTVLRVDQIIMSKPAGGPKPPKNNPNWDE